MALQLAALEMLNRAWTGHYLLATAAALELTLIHNFMWHLNYTWRDRILRGGNWRGTLAGQFVRFHLSNGLVSMLGNLALMPVMVEVARLPVVASNAIAILCCSIVNFFLGDEWVFAPRAEAKQG